MNYVFVVAPKQLNLGVIKRHLLGLGLFCTTSEDHLQFGRDRTCLLYIDNYTSKDIFEKDEIVRLRRLTEPNVFYGIQYKDVEILNEFLLAFDSSQEIIVASIWDAYFTLDDVRARIKNGEDWLEARPDPEGGMC